MKEEYDFSKATPGNHARRMRKYGYTTTVHQRDGSEKVTRYPAEQSNAGDSARKKALKFLREQLQRFGVSFAETVGDDAVDLIAYAAQEEFRACPIVVTASSGERVGIRTQDESLPNLLLAFVWYANDQQQHELYAVPFQDLRELFERRGYLASRSYRQLGGWSIPKPDPELREFMANYRISSGEQWSQQVRAAMSAA